MSEAEHREPVRHGLGAEDKAPAQAQPQIALLKSALLQETAPAERFAAAGLTLAGRYRVLEMVGRGGMGVVLAAYDSLLDRRVALKLLHPSPKGRGSESDTLEARLEREAQAMARLNHPHVVAIYDAGTLEDGSLFLAMEYVRGQTLRQWLKMGPRSWREVLSAYLEAGRGVAAAHAAGLVHRDFKPENVLVGDDGRVRVTDFGVARALSSGTGPTHSQGETLLTETLLQTLPWETPLTQPGRVVGTLRYLAPELCQGQPADALSDLFSFCVALYESLYGQPAFGNNSGPQERLQAQREGRLNPPPADSKVPGWVERVVLQGLAADPRRRPRSMEELLSALADDPELRRRARLRIAAVAGGVVALAGLAVGSWGLSQGPSCAQLARVRLEGVWDEPQKGRMRQALVGTGLVYAQDTAERVEGALADYASEWVRLRTQACEAGQEEAAQARELAVLEVYCLERRRSQLLALTELLARGPDKRLLSEAVDQVYGLPPLEYCTDAHALTAAVPPPEDPAVRARVEALEGQVDRLEALVHVGKYREGVALGEPLLQQTAAVGWVPVHARALYQVAQLRDGAGDYAGAEELVRKALPLAARARDDVLVARTWNALLWSLSSRNARFVEALGLRLAVEAAVARAGDENARAEALNRLGTALKRLDQYEQAREHYERALAIAEKALGPEHPRVARSLGNLALLQWKLGQNEQARVNLERVLAIWMKTLGPEHPEVAYTLYNLGGLLTDLKQYGQAREHYERALALREKVLGPEHPDVAYTLDGLGGLLGDMGQYEQARGYYTRSLALQEKALGPDHSDVADTLDSLGELLWDMGQYEQARAHYARALAIWERAYGLEHPEVAHALTDLGRVLRDMGRYEQSRAHLERAWGLASKVLGPENSTLAEAHSELGRSLVHLGALEAARHHLERALAMKEKAPRTTDSMLACSLQGLGELELAQGRPSQAAPWLERALTLTSASEQAQVRLTLARALWDSGADRPRALALATEARDFYQRVRHPYGLAEASRWLASHPRP